MDPHRHARERLVEAGLGLLASGHNVSTLTPSNVAACAEIPESSLHEEYPDHLDYLAAVHHRLQDFVKQDVTLATANKLPSLERLVVAVDEFLDSALRHPALRELDLALYSHLSKARKQRAFINGFTKIFELECKVLEVSRAQEHSRLFIAMMACVHVAEYEARQPLPEFRGIVRGYVRSLLS